MRSLIFALCLAASCAAGYFFDWIMLSVISAFLSFAFALDYFSQKLEEAFFKDSK